VNIQAEKLEILKMILETDNPGILVSIKRLFEKSSTPDFWQTLTQEQKDEIKQGTKEIENGEFVDFDSLMTKHRR